MQNLNWSDIRVFLEVHRTGTLSAAARSLGVYASTVGRRLDALESEMGTLLFRRGPDGLLPTAAADDMLEAALVMERQAQLITQRLSGESLALRGEVRLTTTPDIASYFLIERLKSFHDQHPEIEVNLQSDTSVVDLTRGETDLALRFTRGGRSPLRKAEEAQIMAHRLVPIGVGLYASGAYLAERGHPPSARDLAGHDVVMPSEPWVPGHDWLIEHASECRCSIRTQNLTELATAARVGHGIAPLPSFMAIAHPELARIRPPDRVTDIQSWLLMPTDLRRVSRVRALWEFLIETFNEWGPLLQGGSVGRN